MMAQEHNDERSRLLQEAISASDLAEFYSNSLAMTISPFDVSFVFGRRVGSQVKNEARVTMSIEHAMVMLMVARRSLREHVNRTGITPSIPPNVLRELQLDEEEPLW